MAGGTRPQGYVHNPNAWIDPFGLAAKSNIVYRVLRHGEDTTKGLFPKNPNATYTVEGLVINNSKPNYASQYISTTRDLSVAQSWARQTGNPIVSIDLNKYIGNVIDVSNYKAMDGILKGMTARIFRMPLKR